MALVPNKIASFKLLQARFSQTNCSRNNLRPMFDLEKCWFFGRLILRRLPVWFWPPLRSVGHKSHKSRSSQKVQNPHKIHKHTKIHLWENKSERHINTKRIQTRIEPPLRSVGHPSNAACSSQKVHKHTQTQTKSTNT